MSNIARLSKDVDRPFLWKDSKDFYHRPKDMDTRHLFFTVRMIWNNSAPDEFKIPPLRLYRFGPFYTPEYMGQAVRCIMAELATRDDLTDYYKRCLEHMDRCLVGSNWLSKL